MTDRLPIDDSYGDATERGDYLEQLPTLERDGSNILEDVTALLELLTRGTLQLKFPADNDPAFKEYFLEQLLHTRRRITIEDEKGERLIVALDMERIDPQFPEQEAMRPYKRQGLVRTVIRVWPTGSDRFPQFSTNGAKGQGARNGDVRGARKSGKIGMIWASKDDKRAADQHKGRIRDEFKPTASIDPAFLVKHRNVEPAYAFRDSSSGK